jgi:hypothetical protein
MEMSVKNYQMHLTRTLLQDEQAAEIVKLQTYWQTKETATRQQPSLFNLPEALNNLSPTHLGDKKEA